jgi:DNA-binding beta-propeller fold protein YncE
MRIPSSVKALSAAAAIALLAGCSGNGSAVPANGVTSQSHARASHLVADRTGVAPKFLQTIHFGHPGAVRPMLTNPKDLAVGDFGSGAIEVLDSSYALEGTISTPADGVWYDRHDNLYSANYSLVTVTEYNPAGTLLFTYTTGLGDPINVTTDHAGNVYVADYGFGSASVVVEYPQGSNTPSASCSTGLANEGIVVDTTGAVFVSGNNPNTGSANLLEYPSGLSGCPTPTTLGVTLGFAGGMQIDKHDNLVACDQLVGVDIIKPPYSSISSTITGAADSFHVALNAKQNRVYIADVSSADVLVDKYPSGANVTTLNGSNGLSDPAGVAAFKQTTL